MSCSVPGPVSRGHWCEEETHEEEEMEKVLPESVPKKNKEMNGGLQINVDEEPFVLPTVGEMEQDILPVQGEGISRPWDLVKQFLNASTCPDSRLAASSQAHPGYSRSAAGFWISAGGRSVSF